MAGQVSLLDQIECQLIVQCQSRQRCPPAPTRNPLILQDGDLQISVIQELHIIFASWASMTQCAPGPTVSAF